MYNFVSSFEILHVFRILSTYCGPLHLNFSNLKFYEKEMENCIVRNINSHTETLAFSIFTSNRSHKGKGQQCSQLHK